MNRLEPAHIAVVTALAIVLGVPFLFRPEAARPEPGTKRIIIITPHNEQIRHEFSVAFSIWHEKHYGEPVIVDWRTPGGTSEIRKQLTAEYQSAARQGQLATMSYDLLFGGGSYEHNQVARKQTFIDDEGVEGTYTISEALGEDVLDQATLDQWYGENLIGRNTLYDPGRHWFGTALSAFGIVFNRDCLRSLEVEQISTWEHLTNPALQGWVALADPGQSGSICTTFEVILNRLGWERGWKVLREAAANSRYFSNSSSKVPIDVGMGEAAAGMCIDFYGRYQSQTITDAGGGDRVGYVDPRDITDIDPDPISLLTGAPNRELAIRFIDFCLTDYAQSLWQFPARESRDGETAAGVVDEAGLPLGPEQFELRRMPARRSMYPRYQEYFRDQVNPFDLATPFENWNSQMRRFIAPLFSAMAIDNHEYLQEAWLALQEAEPGSSAYQEMYELLHRMPVVQLADGTEVDMATTEGLEAMKARWKSDAISRDRDRIAWTVFSGRTIATSCRSVKSR
ncbi:MAG: hypothetical protein HND57_07480 [Planctomycetes bacterium]|nr:hypothetical protein [Planctomycetota bacterium]